MFLLMNIAPSFPSVRTIFLIPDSSKDFALVIILTVPVFSILLTAPLCAVLIDFSYDKLLRKKEDK